MIPVPRKRLAAACGAAALPWAAASFFPWAGIVAAAADCLVAAAALVDLALCLRERVSLRLELPPTFSVGRARDCALVGRKASRGKLALRYAFSMGEGWEEEGAEGRMELEDTGETQVHARLRPRRRGGASPGSLYARWAGPLGLWEAQARFPTAASARVLPDAAGIGRTLDRARGAEARRAGSIAARNGGSGTEVEALREYQRGDALRDVEWKVTTRIGRPVTKVYRAESQSQVVLLLDCGRMMAAEEGGVAALDRAVSAAVALAAAAARVGDQFRAIAFSDRIIGELPPAKGAGALRSALAFFSGIEAERVDSQYGLALEYALARLTRGSILFMVTDFWDEEPFESFGGALAALRRRHRGALILMRDAAIAAAIDAADRSDAALAARAAAQDLALSRSRGMEGLRKRGWPVIDVDARDITRRLVDAYFLLKRGIRADSISR